MAGHVVTTLRHRAEEYLTMRRALGYKLIDTEILLMQFISHLEDIGASVVTTDVAIAWAKQSTRARPNWWRRRLIMVRMFPRHLQTLDPAIEVPASGLLRCFPNRTPPYLYSQSDIEALTRAAAVRFHRPLRVATYRR